MQSLLASCKGRTQHGSSGLLQAFHQRLVKKKFTFAMLTKQLQGVHRSFSYWLGQGIASV